jgi:hypothetical protein
MRESEGEKEHVDRHKLKLFGGQRDRKARKTNEKEERKKKMICSCNLGVFFQQQDLHKASSGISSANFGF